MRLTRSIVPNLFTLANLFMGFSAIVMISQGDFFKGALFILFAGFFDMIDGIVARMFKAASEFGVELDSLCDAVSFGVAPAYMLYKIYFWQMGETGILFASIPALAGVIRLARFNVLLSSLEDKKLFTGLPIPAGAFTIVSYVIFFHLSNQIDDYYKNITIFIVPIVTALAMVSKIKFDNLPRFTLKSIKERPFVFLFFITGVIVSLITEGKFIFPFMLIYISFSALRHFYFWFREKREASDDLDETETEEPGPYDN